MYPETWLKFANGESVEKDVLPLIYRSWKRSSEHNVDPYHGSQHNFLTPSDFKVLKDSQEDLLHAANSVLPFLFQLLNSDNFSILLSDKDAYILESLGCGHFLNKAQRVRLSPGGNWSEEVKGTNAIGTALIENTPIVVLGAEHYVRDNHFLTCSAAPIHGVNNEIIGVLDISSELGNQECTLDIAIIGARLIEQKLHYLKIERELKFHKEGMKLTLNLLKEGFLSLDRSGIITYINTRGASFIGRKTEDLLGRHIAEVLGAPKAWVMNQDVFDLKLKNKSGQELITSFQRISDESGSSLGAVGTIQIKKDNYSNYGWVGSTSFKSRETLERVQRAALTNFSVHLQGPSGTGKEIVAHMLHELSPRKNGPFIAINCAAIPETLLESELFGYADGAFTGARRGGKPGKFELANEGTIFLDEIGDMPLTAQVTLLRLLQEKEVTRIGDKKAKSIDVRVITASHKDLKALVDSNKFRHDLFYRLKVITINLPTLIERLEDLPELVTHFIRKACAQVGRPILGIEDNVFQYFYSYPWPGNVRELENCINSMVAMCTDTNLTINDIPEDIREALTENSSTEYVSMLSQHTRQTILQALAHTNGKIQPAARLLGISRTTLYRKIKEYNIDINEI